MDLDRFLDDREHVAHSQDTPCHAVGMEDLQRVGLLACRYEGDGFACDLADGERGTTAGVAVHLGHDHAVKVHALGKGRCRGDSILAGHGIDDEEHVIGLDGIADGDGLVHHRLVDSQTARRIDDNHVAHRIDGILHGALGDSHGVFAVAAVDAHALLVTQGLQLVGCSGAVDVASGKQRVVALLCQTIGELGGSGCLARALKAQHHDDAGDAAAKVQAHGLAAQKRRELVVDDLDDVLSRCEAFHDLGCKAALLGALDKALDDLEVDVCLEQRHADLLHGGVDIGLGQAALALKAAKHALEFL